MAISDIIQSQIHVHVIGATDNVYWLMQICNVKMRAWNFFPSQTKRHLHFMYLCIRLPFLIRKWVKGLSYVRNADHEKSAPQEVPQTKRTTSLHPKWTLHCTSLLRYRRRLCYIRSGVSTGAEKLLRYKRHYVISDFYLCDTKKDFCQDQNFASQ